ncbi:MAG: CvpA family protein [Bacteroidetes bacterium]|nr:CvpA family protein [Bacteroidota bacterium]
MNILDIIIFAVFLIGFALGYKDGLIRKLIGLVGLALAIYLAAKYVEPVGKTLANLTGLEIYFSKIIAGIFLFFVIISIFSFIKRVIHPFDKVNNFINQLLGAIVGSAQLLFFLSAVFFILSMFGLPEESSTKGSLFYRTVYNILPETVSLLNDYTPAPKKFFDNYSKGNSPL